MTIFSNFFENLTVLTENVILGAAAAVSINPVLVQLAVINGGRKKRDVADSETEKKMSEIGILESFLTTETNFKDQAENMVASYVECSGFQQNKVKLKWTKNDLLENVLVQSVKSIHQYFCFLEKSCQYRDLSAKTGFK